MGEALPNTRPRVTQRSLEGVIIARGALSRAGQIVEEVAPTGRVFLCSDDNVMKYLGKPVTDALTSAGLRVQARTVPPGEKSKSLKEAANLYHWLAAERAERREPLIALGGGCVGDLVGFVAATYNRGIPLVQIPTTLLAQIDSSIGGKVAVDLPAGKNLVGAFYPAQRVIIDPDALASLPRPQLIADYAEVIKTAVIFDADLFDLIEASTDRLDDPALLAELVERCVRWKAKVVDEDPEDRGVRAILNYGHTIAHAIEATAGYGVYRHGEAVAIGMVGAGRLAQETGRWSAADLTRQNNLLAAVGLPASFDGVDPAQILDAMLRDKKVQNGRIRWVLPTTIGQATVNIEIHPTLVSDVVNILATPSPVHGESPAHS